jgi:Rrf2 family protein
MLSRTSQYALRAALELARQPADAAVPASRLAAVVRIPTNYLSKILHDLARAGVLDSSRGSSGGFRLSRPAERVSVADVIGVFQDVGAGQRCLLGKRECRDATGCAAHAAWKRAAAPVWAFFQETTLAELTASAPIEDASALDLQRR